VISRPSFSQPKGYALYTRDARKRLSIVLVLGILFRIARGGEGRRRHDQRRSQRGAKRWQLRLRLELRSERVGREIAEQAMPWMLRILFHHGYHPPHFAEHFRLPLLVDIPL
jgi:hypothetical protein